MLLKRVVLDSSVRDRSRFPTPSRFDADLTPLELRDVKEVRLVYASVPPEPQIAAGRDRLHVRSDGEDFVVVLRPGRYAAASDLAAQVSVHLQQTISNATVSAAYYGAGVKIVSDRPFSVLDGPDSAAGVLGFDAPTNSGAESASHVAYSSMVADGPAVVRIDGLHGLQSNSETMDRAFAVLHDGRVMDPMTIHGSKPSEPYMRRLSVSIVRRDGSLYDTGGRDVTLHLDVMVDPVRT